MKREVYRSVVKGLREYAGTVGDGEKHQGDLQNAVYAIHHELAGVNRVAYHSCFGYMKSYANNYPHLVKDKPLAVFIQVQKHDDLSEEAQFHYLEWLLNMSPWRDVFVSKSVRKVLKDRVIVVDPDQPANFMANAMMGARQCWENYSSGGLYRRINLWWDIAQHVNPTIAFALTHQGLASFDNRQGQIGCNGSGHTVLAYDEKNIFNFVKENKDVNLPLYPNRPDYPDVPDEAWSKKMTYNMNPSAIWRGLQPTLDLLDLSGKAIKTNANISNKVKVNPFLANVETPTYSRQVIAEALISEIPNWEKTIYA